MPSSGLTSPRHSSPPLHATAARWRLLATRVVTLLLVVVMGSGASFAYSVLTHEEIVDLLWSDEIRPLLLKRYPGLSDDQIKEAHAYAYGGAVIQDLGYYPFGSKDFSNLVHYVRSGDFVRELLLESQDANEYAFALGALAHYASDITGHSVAVRSEEHTSELQSLSSISYAVFCLKKKRRPPGASCGPGRTPRPLM